MRYSEAGVARALRVYSRIAEKLGIDGAKHEKPTHQDRVWQHFEMLQRHRDDCHGGKCRLVAKELQALIVEGAEMRAALIEISKIAADAGFGDGHVVDGIRRMAAVVRPKQVTGGEQ